MPRMERDELLALMAAIMFTTTPGPTDEVTARIAVDRSERILKEAERRSAK